MINPSEFRIGNYLMQKKQHRVVTLPCDLSHFEMMATGLQKDLFPVVLKPELLVQCGFTENKDYPLLPSAREFLLLLPVQGSGQQGLQAYVKSNGECFARAFVEKTAVSNPVFHLHALQNLYQALTGKEMTVRL